MTTWLKDFEIKHKKIRVKATGAELDLGFEIAREVLSWVPFYFYEKARKLGALFSKNPHLKIAYSPAQPRPWYLLSVLVYRARLKNTKDYTKADIVVYFEDKTKVKPPQIPAGFTGKTLNFECYDISKSRVAQIFEQIFGYGLAVDPVRYNGPIAVKSEQNGAHDGYAAQGPLSPEQCQNPNLVFQRLVDNSVDNKWVEDLRCPIIGGDIALVFVKRRPLASRFANFNSSVSVRNPEDLLSLAERRQLKKFAAAMGLDQGGLDVLRDKGDGRIYVVDVNKTDMGPPLALSIADKSKAVAILTKQFIKLING